MGDILKTYDVKKIKEIPGTFRSHCKQQSREDVLSAAVNLWPHLLNFKPNRGGGYVRLSINLEKFDMLLERFGADKFGGGFSCWESVWCCRTALKSDEDWSFFAEDSNTLASRQEVMTMREMVNIVALQESLSEGTAQDADFLERYLRSCTRYPNSDFGEVTIEYYRKHGIPGRLYAKSPAGQWMCKEDRAIAFQVPVGSSYGGGAKVFVKIDINNCFATLFYNELDSHIDLDLYGTFVCYKSHYKLWRQFLSEYLNVNTHEAKKILTAIVHLGLPKHDVPFLWNLGIDMQRGIEFLLGLPKFAYLNGLFEERRNPAASRFHYAMAAIEDHIVTETIKALEEIESVAVNTLIFDGAIFIADEVDLDRFRQVVHVMGDRFRVAFDVDVM